MGYEHHTEAWAAISQELDDIQALQEEVKDLVEEMKVLIEHIKTTTDDTNVVVHG